MTIDQFMTTTDERLPTADEIVSLCLELSIAFAVAGGQPVLKPSPHSRQIALLVAKLIGREPWRSQVIDKTKLRIDVVQPAPSKQEPGWKCPCGSTEFKDVPIHNGDSARRDCAECGRFSGFPRWNGQQ